MAAFRAKVKYTLLASAAAAAVCCLVFQKMTVHELIRLMIFGYRSEDPQLAAMMNGGGFLSMVQVSVIVGISSAYAGIFEGTGLLLGIKRYVEAVSRRITPFGGILACHLRYFDTELPYTVAWTEVDTTKHALLLENRTLEVWSVPLRHRVPCAGFLFREKEPPLNVEKFKIAKYGLSIAQITAAKRGEEIRLATGEVIPNAELTYRPYAPRSYAYLSDTNYSAKAAGLCRGVDLMYHEATYAAAEQRSARDRGHSTTTDAAKAALKAGARRLVIGHYSSRYKDETPLVEEARTLFAESYPATEGTTYTIEKQR